MASMDGVAHRLMQRSKPSNLLFVGELRGGRFSPKMVRFNHLCSKSAL